MYEDNETEICAWCGANCTPELNCPTCGAFCCDDACLDAHIEDCTEEDD